MITMIILWGMSICMQFAVTLYGDYRIEIYEDHDSNDSWGNTHLFMKPAGLKPM